MQCPCRAGKGPETILAYLGGRLEPGTAALLEQHFTECRECQELLLAEQVVWDALDAWEPPPVSADFDRKLYHRIEEEEVHRHWWRQLLGPVLPFSVRPAMAVAVLCLILVAGVLMRVSTRLGSPSVASVDSIDVQQVEQAAQDMEMLYVLEAPLLEQERTNTSTEQETGALLLRGEENRCG